jgi:hypothetical protein
MFGQAFTVAGILQATGTPLDNTMLLTLSAAQRLSEMRAARRTETLNRQAEPIHLPRTLAAQRLAPPGNGISTVLIRIRDGLEPQQVATQLALQGWDLDVAVAPAYITALRRHLSQTRRLMGWMATVMLCLTVFVGLAAWLPTTVRRKLSPRHWRRSASQARVTHGTSPSEKEIAIWHRP